MISAVLPLNALFIILRIYHTFEKKFHFRRDSNTLGVAEGPSRRESDCSALSEITECEDSPVKSSKMRDRRKRKSLTWKKKIDDDKDDSTTQDCLLPQDNSVSGK